MPDCWTYAAVRCGGGRDAREAERLGQEEDGEVGLEVIADGGVEGKDAFAAELAARALVGLGGVGVAVTEDDGAGGEGGAG